MVLIVTGAAPERNGRPGRRRPMPTGRRRGSKARLAVFPMSAMRAGSFRPRASISCSIRYGRSARRRSASSGRSESTIPASPLPTCRRSTWFWCRTPITIISISRLCRGSLPRHRPRVITPLGNDTIMRNHDPAIAAKAYDWDDRRGARRACGGDSGSDAALVGAQSVRPQHVAVGIVRDRGASGANLFRRRFRLRRRPSFPPTRASGTDRSISPSCRSAPMSRAGSCATST